MFPISVTGRLGPLRTLNLFCPVIALRGLPPLFGFGQRPLGLRRQRLPNGGWIGVDWL